jgi:hypothetical protein
MTWHKDPGQHVWRWHCFHNVGYVIYIFSEAIAWVTMHVLFWDISPRSPLQRMIQNKSKIASHLHFGNRLSDSVLLFPKLQHTVTGLSYWGGRAHRTNAVLASEQRTPLPCLASFHQALFLQGEGIDTETRTLSYLFVCHIFASYFTLLVLFSSLS